MPLLRLQSDERLVALIRRGHHGAFEALVARYESRLLAFCRHMLNSREDAEDVLQEVFAAAFNAMLADEREINVRPWLYRIARNRSLNHLRRTAAIGVDSMDVHFADHGQSTGDKVFKREAFRQLIEDVTRLPETQRTALLLREMDALSYEHIAEAMETTVPSVKSLLVRARVSLAEAAEARKLTCDEVRLELGEAAEGLTKISPPVRRHLRDCRRCEGFRKELKANNKVMAAVFPVGAVLLAKKFILAKLGATASASGAQVGGATAAAGAGAGAAGAAGAGGGASIVAAGAGALATKAVAGLAAAAIVTAGAVEVNNNVGPTHHIHPSHPVLSASAVAPTPVYHVVAVQPAPVVVRSVSQRASGATGLHRLRATIAKSPKAPKTAALLAPVTHTTTVVSTTTTNSAVATKPPTTQVQSDVTVLPSTPSTPPATPVSTPVTPPPATDTTSTATASPTPTSTSDTATAPSPTPPVITTTDTSTATTTAPATGTGTAAPLNTSAPTTDPTTSTSSAIAASSGELAGATGGTPPSSP